MDFSWTQALETLGPGAVFRVINEARPPANYLLAQFLPERPSTSYHVEDGSLTIRATMAGLVGMDSPYPPGGIIDASTFMAESAKIAMSIDLPEKTLRTIQEMVMRLQLAGGGTTDFLAREVLNIADKLLAQPIMDTAEWMRGQCLANGEIDWTFNAKNLLVDYGIPNANKLTHRTTTAAYGGSASTFWADIKAARRLLRHNVRAFIAHPNMIDEIIYNDANHIQVLAQSFNGITIQRLIGDNERPSSDAMDTVTLLSYGLESEVLDISSPGATTKVPFWPEKKIAAIGNDTGTQYVVGAGANAPEDFAVGYFHSAPTVESGGNPGRWGRVYTPENRPWALRGETAANGLPVLSAPEKVVILYSDFQS